MVTTAEKLTESPGALKQHPHTGASYYAAEQIISALNYALGPTGWDWECLEYGLDVEADEVWCLGKLTARMLVTTADGDVWQTTTKIERGYQAVGRKRDGSAISYGDSSKGAASDALKRCARLLGVGLDAWAKDAPAAQPRRAPSPARPTSAITTTEQVRAASMVTGAAPAAATDTDRPALLVRYSSLVVEARRLGFGASWADTDPSRFSNIQIVKYSEQLENYLARTRPAAGVA